MEKNIDIGALAFEDPEEALKLKPELKRFYDYIYGEEDDTSEVENLSKEMKDKYGEGEQVHEQRLDLMSGDNKLGKKQEEIEKAAFSPHAPKQLLDETEEIIDIAKQDEVSDEEAELLSDIMNYLQEVSDEKRSSDTEN